MPLKQVLIVAITCLGVLVTAGCQTTNEVLQETAKKHAPGDPAYSWVNGLWTGSDDRWDKWYWMKVVDGNKIIGEEESCSRARGGCSGRVPLWGEIIAKETLDVTYDKRKVPGVERLFRQDLVRQSDGTLWGPGFVLKKEQQ